MTMLLSIYSLDREKVEKAIIEIGANTSRLSKKRVEGWEFYDISEDVCIMYGKDVLAITGDKKEALKVKSRLEEKLGIGFKETVRV